MNSTLPLMNSDFSKDKGNDYGNDPNDANHGRTIQDNFTGVGAAAHHDASVSAQKQSIKNSKSNIGSSYQSRYDHSNQDKFVSLTKSSKFHSKSGLISQNTNGLPRHDE